MNEYKTLLTNYLFDTAVALTEYYKFKKICADIEEFENNEENDEFRNKIIAILETKEPNEIAQAKLINIEEHEEKMKLEKLRLLQDKVDNFLKAEELLALDIIEDEKYKTLPAITAILQFITDDNCTTLEGEKGAFAMYDAYLPGGFVVGTIEEALEDLDAIEGTQRYLYQLLGQADQAANDYVTLYKFETTVAKYI